MLCASCSALYSMDCPKAFRKSGMSVSCILAPKNASTLSTRNSKGRAPNRPVKQVQKQTMRRKKTLAQGIRPTPPEDVRIAEQNCATSGDCPGVPQSKLPNSSEARHDNRNDGVDDHQRRDKEDRPQHLFECSRRSPPKAWNFTNSWQNPSWFVGVLAVKKRDVSQKSLHNCPDDLQKSFLADRITPSKIQTGLFPRPPSTCPQGHVQRSACVCGSLTARAT